MAKSDLKVFGWTVFSTSCLRTSILVVAAVLMGQSCVARPQAGSGSVPAIPRTADGRPDLTGVWEVLNTAAWDVQPHNADAGIPGGLGVVEGGEIPYKAAALATKKENFSHRMTEDTDSKCYLPGVPRVTYMPYPFQITQTPDYVSILYEYRHINRTFPTNSSKHPEAEVDYWMGDSRGHWEGGTLVVDVINFNDQTWFDKVGDYHSDALHVSEHYSLVDKDHMNYDVTVEDPNVFTRPWKMSMPVYRRIEPNIRVLEYDCNGFEHLFHVPGRAGQAHGENE